ncbi:MAG TPA: cytochrome B6, partial [Isosphaeraceae bacterium]|nr:cytochrome B6 [Isosphaeraceae bacterium]
DRRPSPTAPPDAITDAQTPRPVKAERAEQQKTQHDRSDRFAAPNAMPSSKAFEDQPEKGQFQGFDFYRDPLDAKRPMQTFEEIMQADIAAKPKVMATQRKLLESRYNLEPKLDPVAKMSRGKPLCVGPTARLSRGTDWDRLAKMDPEEIRRDGLFPYPSLPHPKQTPGGQVFPPMQIAMFPRLERFDVEFDLPEAFLPEFPPAIFLSNRPELGDVSRGEVVSINNFYRLFKDILTPVQLSGLQFLLTPFPQEEFNPTDDRKSAQPSLGVACFDCHVNGHTTGQFHLNPDDRPEQRRFRLDTTSLRGMFNQQIHASKRSLRSVEDFTEFEQRTAYFNGDPIHAMKKGFIQLDRVRVSHMAQLQNMLDFPPAPELTPLGRLDPAQATESERRGEALFFGKAQCSVCHPAPFYLDQQMHDLHLERFLEEPGDGPIKSFTLRGIKDSPPYLHDGRCLTLEDTVEFFNLVLGLKLSKQEKADLVAFMRQL